MLLCDLAPEVVPLRAVMLSGNVVLLLLPGGVAADLGQVPPPYGTVDLPGLTGDARIAAMRLPGELPEIALRPMLHAMLGQAPRFLVVGRDAAALASDLDQASCGKLLGFLLGFCRTAFGLGTDQAFAGACAKLAGACARDAGRAVPVATAGPGWTVVRGVDVPAGTVLFLLGARGVRQCGSPALEDGARIVSAVQEGDIILALGDEVQAWTVESAATVPDVLWPGGGRDDAALRSACLHALSVAPGPGAADLRLIMAARTLESQVFAPASALRHDDPSSPLGATLEVALLDGEGGLFLRGWVRDPLNLVVGAELRSGDHTAGIPPSAFHRVRRRDVIGRYRRAAFGDAEAQHGFVAHVTDPSQGACQQPGLLLRLRSGRAVEVRAPLRRLPAGAARDAILSCVPPNEVTPTMLDTCLAPAAAALHRRALAGRAKAEAIYIGPPVARPMVTIIVPLYRNLGFLRFQAAAFARDADCRRAELIYVLDSPEQRAEVEHLLRGLFAVHCQPFTLLVMARNMGYAAANNAAAAVAGGSALLLLNSDVVPARPGWLGLMRRGLGTANVGAVGPKLLFDDGSIQHAGLYFERDAENTWFNAHYHKGMPGQWPAARRRRLVPGVTGAALLVRRGLFEAVGGLSEDYIIGDYEDSDFCLKLRAAGAAVGYVPEAELYHFERRSISLHAGYARTLASLYNRRLHHRRWDGAMAALMVQPGYRVAA